MKELSNIYDIFKQTGKFGGKRYTGDFGVEIETEVDSSKRYEYPRLKYWVAKKDGSLRDYGVEYILKEPLDLKGLSLALDEFDGVNKTYEFRKDSISTSVHVHLNFLNETFLSLVNFMTTYAIVENLLIRYSGPDRLSNLFCLPMMDAEGAVTQFENLLKMVNKRMFGRLGLSSERCKYAALNMANLTTLGTAEVRSFRGETDKRIIFQWAEILLKMKEYAKRPNLDPVKIILEYKRLGANAFVDLVFQEHANVLKQGKETENLCKVNLTYAAKFASITTDWKKFGILKIKPIYKEKLKKPLDELSIEKFGSPFDVVSEHERTVISEMYHLRNNNVRTIEATADV